MVNTFVDSLSSTKQDYHYPNRFYAVVSGKQSDIWENGIYSSISSPNSIVRSGPQGVAGAKGDKGDKGEDGFDGMKGERGPMGPPGLTGVAGLPGLDGMRGLEGQRGPKGEPGTCPVDCSSAGFGDKFALDAATSGFAMVGQKGDKGDRGWSGNVSPISNEMFAS
jgi:hypothetical protein